MSGAGPRLILRADAGHRLGSGHVMRLAALAEAAIDAGGAAQLLIGGEPAASVAGLRARGLDAVALAPAATADDPLAGAAIAAAAAALAADAIVVDGPHFAPAAVDALRDGGRALASLDDRGLAPLPTPIVINPGYGAEALGERYPGARIHLLGRRFHLLRREFRTWPHGGPALADDVRRVVVTMGGSDPVGATARVVTALPGHGLEVVVVLGPGFRDHAGLAAATARAAARDHRVTTVADPAALAPVLAGCELAISAAGGTLAELAYLGRPVYAIAIVDDQRAVADRQRAARLIAGGRPLADLTDGALADDLAALLADGPRRRALATAAAATIDGLGPARIVAALHAPRFAA